MLNLNRQELSQWQLHFIFWKDVGEMFSFLQMIEVTHSFLVQNKPENGLKTRRIIYGEKKFKPVRTHSGVTQSYQ